MQSKQLLHVVVTGLLLSFNCQFIQDASAESSNPTTGVPKVKTPVKQGVQFSKIQIRSVDLTLQEVASLDKRIVEIRDTLHSTRKSIHTLIGGDRPKFKNELQGFLKSGALSITQKDGLPSLKFKKKKQSGRAFEVYQSMKNLEQSIRFSKDQLPALAKNLKKLHQKSQTVLERAPSELRQSVQTGKIELTEINVYLKKVNNNTLLLKKVPVHLEQVKTQIVKNTTLIKNLFQK